MKDLPFFIFLTVLVLCTFGVIPIKNNDLKISTVCSLKHEAYTYDFNELKRNKGLDLLCLCTGK